MWRRAAWAALFLTFFGGSVAKGAVSVINHTKCTNVGFSQRCIVIGKNDPYPDSTEFFGYRFEIVFAEALRGVNGCPRAPGRREIGKAFVSFIRKLIAAISYLHEALDAKMVGNAFPKVPYRIIPCDLSSIRLKLRSGCNAEEWCVIHENKRAIFLPQNVKLSLNCGCRCGGIEPCEKGEHSQKQSEEGDSPVRRVVVFQEANYASKPPYWTVIFFPVGLLPWLAWIGLIRNAHALLSPWRTNLCRLVGCLLIGAALFCATLPFLQLF